MDVSKDPMNSSSNARRRDKAFLYADHKDEQKDSRDKAPRMAPIDLTNVNKWAPESNSTEKLLGTSQRLAGRDSISD